MIRELSSWVAKWLEQEGAISGKDNRLFSYAVYSLLFGLLPIFIVMLLGLAFGMLREGLLMIAPFILIRKFSGGYHLSSPKLCVAFSAVVLALVMRLIKLIIREGYITPLTVLVSLSVICLCKFSPVENEMRKLSKTEIQCFRKVTRLLALAALSAYFFFYYTKQYDLAVPIGVGILLPALLQFPCVPRFKRSPRM